MQEKLEEQSTANTDTGKAMEEQVTGDNQEL